MLAPRAVAKSFPIALRLLCLCLLAGGAQAGISAQQLPAVLDEDTARGIELYKQGDAQRAIETLGKVIKKRKEDVNAWYYLGLALHSKGEMGAARIAFETVIKLSPNIADAHAKLSLALILYNDLPGAIRVAHRALELGDQSAEVHYVLGEAHFRQDEPAKALEEAEAALRIKSDLSAALILKSFAHLALKQLNQAAESMERFLALDPNDSDAETWREQMKVWRRLAPTDKQNNPDATRTIFKPSEVTTKAHISSRPEPQYTEAARKAGAQGTVVLRAVFASDGTVQHIRVIRPLGYGLTTKAVKAARGIISKPATLDGRPVSQYIQIEYNFNLY
jgi:TonB family protein